MLFFTCNNDMGLGVGVRLYYRHFQRYFSYISWWSVLLVEETEVPVRNHRPAASHWQTLSYNAVSSTPSLSGIRTHNVSNVIYNCCFVQSRCDILSLRQKSRSKFKGYSTRKW